MLTLSPTQRRELRARAHPLHPVVAIGHAGLTPPVLHEIDIALSAHELVKVRVHSDDRDERERFLVEICDGLDAAPVQHLGKLLIVWRPKPQAAPAKRERPGKATKKSKRRDPRSGSAGAPAQRGRADPSIGPRARKHRRGAARHGSDAFGSTGAPHATRRRPRSPIVEPAVPTTSASRGARYSQGKPVGPKNRRAGPPPKSKRGPAVGADEPLQRRRDKRSAAPDPSSARPPQAPRRRPTTQRDSPAATSRAPKATPRRRRPTGGR